MLKSSYKYKFLNKMAGFSLNFLGASAIMWNMKHNVIHHAYTNIDGVDDDIDIKPWMRMSSTQPKYIMHRYQHIYFWFLYAMLYIWVIIRRLSCLISLKGNWMQQGFHSPLLSPVSTASLPSGFWKVRWTG